MAVKKINESNYDIGYIKKLVGDGDKAVSYSLSSAIMLIYPSLEKATMYNAKNDSNESLNKKYWKCICDLRDVINQLLEDYNDR